MRMEPAGIVLDSPDARELAGSHRRLLGRATIDDRPWLGGPRVAGAVVADHQPQQGVRVHLDPAGPPFYLFLPGS